MIPLTTKPVSKEAPAPPKTPLAKGFEPPPGSIMPGVAGGLNPAGEAPGKSFGGRTPAASAARWQYELFTVAGGPPPGLWSKNFGSGTLSGVSATGFTYTTVGSLADPAQILQQLNGISVKAGQIIYVTFTASGITTGGPTNYTSVQLQITGGTPVPVNLVNGTQTIALIVNGPVTNPFLEFLLVSPVGQASTVSVFSNISANVFISSNVPQHAKGYNVNPAINHFLIACGSPPLNAAEDDGFCTVEFLNGGSVVSSMVLAYGNNQSQKSKCYASVPDEVLSFYLTVQGFPNLLVTNSPLQSFNLFRWSGICDHVRFLFDATACANQYGNLAAITQVFSGVLQRSEE